MTQRRYPQDTVFVQVMEKEAKGKQRLSISPILEIKSRLEARQRSNGTQEEMGADRCS